MPEQMLDLVDGRMIGRMMTLTLIGAIVVFVLIMLLLHLYVWLSEHAVYGTYMGRVHHYFDGKLEAKSLKKYKRVSFSKQDSIKDLIDVLPIEQDQLRRYISKRHVKQIDRYLELFTYDEHTFHQLDTVETRVPLGCSEDSRSYLLSELPFPMLVFVLYQTLLTVSRMYPDNDEKQNQMVRGFLEQYVLEDEPTHVFATIMNISGTKSESDVSLHDRDVNATPEMKNINESIIRVIKGIRKQVSVGLDMYGKDLKMNAIQKDKERKDAVVAYAKELSSLSNVRLDAASLNEEYKSESELMEHG